VSAARALLVSLLRLPWWSLRFHWHRWHLAHAVDQSERHRRALAILALYVEADREEKRWSELQRRLRGAR
jgi:hypothetical protein